MDFFGQITPPAAITRFGGTQGEGLIFLLNNLLQVFFVIAGVYALWQFINAGWTMMSSGGDAKKINQGRDKIIWAFLGLLVMAGAFVLAAIMGFLLFGDVTAIINPKLTGPN